MKNFLILVFTICVGNTYAQGLKLAGVEYATYKNSKVTDAASDDVEVSFQEVKAFLNIPVKFKGGKTVLINGLTYKNSKATLSNSPLFESNDASKELHSISYGLTLLHRWNKWAFLAMAKPTLASDFEDDISSDDFLFQGTALVSRKVGNKLTVGAGATYTSVPGEPTILPAIQVKLLTKKNTLDIFLPAHATYLRHLGPRGKISVGLKAAIDGNNYNVSLKEFSVANPNSITNIIYSRINMGPVIQYKMYRVLHLQAFGGISARRTYEFDGAKDASFDYDSENAPFVSFGISLSPPKKKSN